MISDEVEVELDEQVAFTEELDEDCPVQPLPPIRDIDIESADNSMSDDEADDDDLPTVDPVRIAVHINGKSTNNLGENSNLNNNCNNNVKNSNCTINNNYYATSSSSAPVAATENADPADLAQRPAKRVRNSNKKYAY